MKKTLFCFSMLLLCVLCSLGCNKSGIKTEFVEGVVTYKGAPVAEATVTFSPTDTTGVLATGITNAEGKYVLTATQGGSNGKGAVAGDYKVGISKSKNVAPQPTQEQIQQASEKGEDITKKFPTKYEYLVPKKYSIPSNSGLTAKIQSGKNTINFDLAD